MGDFLKLSEVCQKGNSNIAMKDLENRLGEYEIYGASGLIKKVDFYQQEQPYIAIVKDGAGVGRVMKLPAKSSVIGTMQYIIPNEGIDVNFLAYALEHLNLSRYNTGATIPHIYFKDYCVETIPAYPLSEQKQIAGVLDKISGMVSLRRKQLSKLDELVKSRFIELFGAPIYSDKYSTRKLSSCVANKADMVDGPFGSQVNTKVDYIENGEIPVIRTVNVKMMQFSTDDLKFMSREKYETVIRSQVLPGDVILTKVGTIGNVCIFPNEYQEAVLSTTGSCRIRVDENIVNKVFFAYNLIYLKDKLLEIASTGVQPFLNMNHIKNIDVLDVPLKQQVSFASFVERTDKSKLAIQKSLEKLETLKKALMQKHFG